VPPHWTAEERVAVIEAAELGGFHVLSLINDGTAVALHYAFGKKYALTFIYFIKNNLI
jgi:hypoxia up-regulated 1